MKNLIKKSLIAGLGVLLFGIYPNLVNAANYSFGNAEFDSNVTKIPVFIEVEEDEATPIVGGQFGCKANHTGITCEVSPLTVVTGTTDSLGTYAYSYVGDGVETSFPAGKTKIADLIVTNSANSKKENIKITLEKAKIENDEKQLETFTDIGAKPIDKGNLSDDATAKNIKFSQGIMYPEFSPDVTKYTVYNIADTINTVKVIGTCNEGQCDITPRGGKSVSGNTITLNQGENTVTVEVWSENGVNNINYTFTVIRGETSFNSSKLKDLSFGEYPLTPAFASDVTEYTLTIPNQVISLNNIYKLTPLDKDAKTTIKGTDNFVIGENTLTITVDNVAGNETTTYKVKVIRMGIEDINIIFYKDNDIIFTDSNGTKHQISVTDFKEQYAEEYKKIESGEYKFDDKGNRITETQPTDDKKEENNNTNKKTEKKKSNLWIIIILIVIGLAIIVVSGLLIFKKDKKKDEDNIDSEKKDDTQSNNVANEINGDAENPSSSENESFDDTINEEGIEESIIANASEEVNETPVDIDDALNDLMVTRNYDFKDKD